MTVTDYIAHRVVPFEKAVNLKIGDVVSIPRERDDFDCAENKKITEQTFEDVRKANFSTFPSRKACLFVLPSEKRKALQWVEDHYPHDVFHYALLTLNLNGELIWCDEDKYTKAGIMCRDSIDLAHEYWGGASDKYDSFEFSEGLFVGRAEVVKIENCYHIAQHPL